MGWSQSHRDSRRVLRWIKSARLRVVSREEIRREALNRKLDASQTEKILVQLVAAGWLLPLIHATGGRPARRWEVNVALFDECGGNVGKSDK